MTKILFLCVWYCSIFPAAYLLCAFSLFLKYYVDKFSLVRTWERAPHLGNAIAWISHSVFFPLALIATSVMSSYFWSGFPYDNLCEADSGEGIYEYCRQNYFAKGGIFPFVKQLREDGAKWMTADQEIITTISGWSSVVFSAAVLIKFVLGWIKVYQALRTSYYKVRAPSSILLP